MCHEPQTERDSKSRYIIISNSISQPVPRMILFRYIIVSHSISQPVPRMILFRYIIVSHSISQPVPRMIFRIVKGVTIRKKHLWYRMEYILIFNKLEEI